MATPTPSPSATSGLPDFTNMTNEELQSWAQGGLYSSSAATSGTIQDNSMVYLGQGVIGGITAPESTSRKAGVYAPPDSELAYSQAKNLPLQWTPDQLRSFVNTGILRKAPGFDVGMGMPEIMSAWDDLVKSSYAFNQSAKSDKKWTPFDVLDTYSNEKNKFGTVKRGEWEYDVATGERIRYLGKLTKTTTQKSVDLTSVEDAKALTTSVLTQALGRAPTAKEFAQYRASINAMERANPSTATTTTTYNPNLATGELETVSSNTTNAGGVSAEALQNSVLEGAKDTSEYGKYQSATTYWDAMMQMMSGGS